MSWLRVALAPACVNSAGRLRWLCVMPVGTKNGHSTDAPTCSVTSCRSWYSVSLRLTTACLLTLYTPMLGAFTMPAMLAVLTMWPRHCGSRAAASSIIGVNTRTPCTTPIRFTPSTHSQSLRLFSQISPPEPTPALLNTRCGAPKRSNAAAPSACICSALDTSTLDARTCAPAAVISAAQRSSASC